MFLHSCLCYKYLYMTLVSYSYLPVVFICDIFSEKSRKVPKIVTEKEVALWSNFFLDSIRIHFLEIALKGLLNLIQYQ